MRTLFLTLFLPVVGLGQPPRQPLLFKVDRADLTQLVRERGAVQAETSATASVPALALPMNEPLTIKWLIENGTLVKKGDRIAELDDSALREAVQMQRIGLAQAEARLVAAQRDRKRAELQGSAEVRAAESKIQKLETDLAEAKERTELQQKRRQLRVKIAEAHLQQTRMAPDADSDLGKLHIQIAELSLEHAQLEWKELELDRKAQQRELTAAQQEARDILDLAKLKAEDLLEQSKAAVDAAILAAEQQKAKLDAALRALNNTTLLAPIDGLATHLVGQPGRAAEAVAVGDQVRAGQPLLLVSDVSKLRIETRIHEAQVSTLQPGQPVRVRIDALPDMVVEGKVQEVSPVAAPASWRNADVKVYPVRISLNQQDQRLKPGMTAQVEIITGVAKRVLRIPKSSVIRQGGKTYCQVQDGDGLRRQEITLGISDGNFVEVKSGLAEGDQVMLPKE